MVNVTVSNISGSEARVVVNTPRDPSQVLPTEVKAPVAYTVEHTRTGIPVTLIWVPYVVFSVILIGLMVTSFYRFHRKHGHKYRRRRAELWRQLNVTDIFNQFQNQTTGAMLPPNGGVNMRVPIEAPTPSYSQPPPAPQPSSSHHDSYFIHSNPVTHSSRDSHGNRSSSYHGSKSKSSSKASTSGGASSSKRHRRPLVFTSNVNGSMVDVRCGESDSLKTFRTLQPAEASEPTSIWTLPYKKSTILRPPYSGKYRTDDIEDDEVFLLHQTKL